VSKIAFWKMFSLGVVSVAIFFGYEFYSQKTWGIIIWNSTGKDLVAVSAIFDEFYYEFKAPVRIENQSARGAAHRMESRGPSIVNSFGLVVDDSGRRSEYRCSIADATLIGGGCVAIVVGIDHGLTMRCACESGVDFK
jgi:hypothetical protein